MAHDLAMVRRQSRRAYELGRVRSALIDGIPLVLLAVVAAWLGPRPWFDAVVAAMLCATGLVFLWRGQTAGRAVMPGVAAGLVPLTLTHIANGLSPGCGSGQCTSYCMHACVVGGVLGGLLLVRFARRDPSKLALWGWAGPLTLMTGVLGCGCVGFTGALAIVGAVVAVSAPSIVRWARAS